MISLGTGMPYLGYVGEDMLFRVGRILASKVCLQTMNMHSCLTHLVW